MLMLELALGIAFGVALVPWAFRCIQWIINALALCRYRLGLAVQASRPWIWWVIGWIVLEWLGKYYGPQPWDLSRLPLR